MGNKMGNKNYTNFSKHFNKNRQNIQDNYNSINEANNVEEENVLEVENDIVDNIPENIQETENENTVEEVNSTDSTQTIGFVSGCKKLYVRTEPSKDSEPLCIIEKDAELTVDLEKSTSSFFKVKTASGIEGYCMKDFIVTR